MSDRKKEVTWRDMLGATEMDKRMNFALWRRGKLDMLLDIDDAEERRVAYRKRSANKAFISKWARRGPDKGPDMLLITGNGAFLDTALMRIKPETDDDMASVKAASRQWATLVTGHDFTQIADAPVRRSDGGEKKKSGFRGTPGPGFRKAGWTTVEERLAIREAAKSAAKKLGVRMGDLARAVGFEDAEFLSPSALRQCDSRGFLAVRGIVEQIERGEVTSLPKKQTRVSEMLSFEQRMELRRRLEERARALGITIAQAVRRAGCKSPYFATLTQIRRCGSDSWLKVRTWLAQEEKEAAS